MSASVSPNFIADTIDTPVAPLDGEIPAPSISINAGQPVNLTLPIPITPDVTITAATSVNDKEALADDDARDLKPTRATIEIGIAF